MSHFFFKKPICEICSWFNALLGKKVYFNYLLSILLRISSVGLQFQPSLGLQGWDAGVRGEARECTPLD